jgi:LysM repeat protein
VAAPEHTASDVLRRFRILGMFVVVSAVLAPGRATAGPATHTIVAGDNLWSIARRHGCSIDAVREANGMSAGDALRVGKSLTIPACGGRVQGSSGTYTVRAGDTLSSIALRHRTSVEALQARNDLSTTVIRVGQTLDVSDTEAYPLRLVAGQSVGRPQHGKLVTAARLPADGSYVRRRPERAYGAQHVIDHVRRAIANVRAGHPGLHRLAVGDISAQRGGAISGHRSHQSGRDVDLGLYFERVPAGYPKEFVRAKDGRLDAAATWALVYELYQASKLPGGPERVFLDYEVQGQLHAHAKAHGVSKRVLRAVFQYPSGKWTRERFVAHEPKHDDHLHVRFGCPPRDTTCK